MSTKHITRIVLAILCIVISLSICSCTGLSLHANNIATFAGDITSLASSLNTEGLTSEKKLAMANELFHPSSDLTVEKIWEEIQTHEKFAEIGTIESINIGEMPDMDDLMNLMKYDAATNTMTYHAEVQILINGEPFLIGLDLLSDESGMGISGYSVE